MIDIKPIPLRKIITFPSNGGEKFKCCVHDWFDALNTSKRNPGSPPGFGGAEGDLLQTIVDWLGIDCDYYVPNDEWGKRNEHNIWTGCRGMLQRKNVDFVLGAHMKHHWINVFAQSSTSYQSDRVGFISKLPLAEPTPDVIIRAFDSRLWLAIVVCICFVAFVFYWMQKRRYSMVDQIYSRISELLLQEPVAKIEPSPALNILCFVWALSAQFIALAYMAVILGIMMMPKRAPPLDNDDKLLEAVKFGKYKVGVFKENPQFVTMLLHSTYSKHVELGKILLKNKWFLGSDADKKIVSFLENDWAICISSNTGKKILPVGYDYVVSKDILYIAAVSPIISRSWPLKKKLETVVTRIVEHGIYEKDIAKYFFKFRLESDITTTATEAHQGIRPLNLTDLQGAFLLLGTGLGISIIVLIYEIVSFKLSSKSRLKDSKPGIEIGNQDAININHE